MALFASELVSHFTMDGCFAFKDDDGNSDEAPRGGSSVAVVVILVGGIDSIDYLCFGRTMHVLLFIKQGSRLKINLLLSTSEYVYALLYRGRSCST